MTEEVTKVEVKEQASEVLVKQLREIAEDVKSSEASKKEAMDAINVKLDEQEVKNQDLVKSLAESKKFEEDMKEKHDSLEKTLQRAGTSEAKDEASAEMKAFAAVMKKGRLNLNDEEIKALRTDNNIQGGYLAPTEYVIDLIKKITEISPIRSVARIRQTSRESITIPTRDTLQSATWAGECDTVAPDNSTYGSLEIKVNRLTSVVEATIEMLGDAAFNMDAEVRQDTAERFAQSEGAAFVNGNGVTKPEGFLQNASVTVESSGEAATYDADDLIRMAGELKTGYNGMYGLNRKEIAFIRQLKDGNGQYLWVSGLAAGMPNTINGHAYVEMPDMPDRGADATPVIFADFPRFYTIVDHTVMTMVRDDFTLQNQGKVRFIAHRRVGGQVQQAEAGIILKCEI